MVELIVILVFRIWPKKEKKKKVLVAVLVLQQGLSYAFPFAFHAGESSKT
jgi:hypothetical protein